MTGLKKGGSGRVLVGMSGRLDSAVAALVLKNQGFEVIGLHLYVQSRLAAGLPGQAERSELVDQSRRLCDRLGILFQAQDVTGIFEERVLDTFIQAALEQRAIDVDVVFQDRVVLPTLFQRAEELKCAAVGGGWYARIGATPIPGTTISQQQVHRASDLQRDQSHLFWVVGQQKLGLLQSPLGGLPSSRVEKLGQEFKLLDEIRSTPGSWGAYLDGRREDVALWIEARTSPALRPGGGMRTPDGLVIGQHQGLHRYVPGMAAPIERRDNERVEYLVTGVEFGSKTLLVGFHKDLGRRKFSAVQTHWLSPVDPLRDLACMAKIGPGGEEAPCFVTIFENQTVHINFADPQTAGFPGRGIFFYRGTELLGGAVIDRAIS